MATITKTVDATVVFPVDLMGVEQEQQEFLRKLATQMLCEHETPVPHIQECSDPGLED